MRQVEELSIEVINDCAVRCIHCSSGSVERKGNITIPLGMNTHFRIMKEARELGATTLSLSGGDPILLGDSLFGYLGEAVDLGYKRILLYTTGIWDVSYARTYVGEEVSGLRQWKHLKDLYDYADDGLAVIFSLHSHRSHVNDFIMGLSGAWRAIVEGIESCAEFGITTQVHFVPMLPNYKDLPEVRNLCESLGVSMLSVLRFVPQTRGFLNMKMLGLGAAEFAELQAIMDELDVEMTGPSWADMACKLRFGCPSDFRHATPGTSRHANKLGKTKPCHAGQDLILVRPDGSVHPCAAWKSLPNDSNVLNASLQEIWEKDVMFNAIRHFTENGYEHQLGGHCSSCRWLESCRGGCPAQRLHQYGKCLEDMYYHAPDPLCPTQLGGIS